MALWRELGNLDALRFPLIHLAHVACRQGQLAEARAHLKESLAMCRQRGEKRLIVECLEGLAEVALAECQWEPAARLFGAAASLREAIGWPVEGGRVEEYDHQVSTLRDALGERAFAAAWAAGAALSWTQAADYGLEV
jgi:Tetratricopeptide repeat